MEPGEPLHRLVGRRSFARGEKEARPAGTLLAAEGLAVDSAHTSVLTRAIRTLDLALEEMGRLWVPVRRNWRLNERHYGGLTGLDKAETKASYGDEKFMAWRRSYDVPPPPMPAGHAYDVRADPRYAGWPPTSFRPPSAWRTWSCGSCRTGTTPSRRSCWPGAPCSSPPTATACGP